MLSLPLVLAACTTTESADASEDRCGEVMAALDNQNSDISATQAELRKMVSSGIITVDGETRGYGVLYVRATQGQLRGEINTLTRFTDLQAEGRAETRVLLRIILNDRSCFTPRRVARAQDAFENLKSWGSR
jgi:hypothetical protein